MDIFFPNTNCTTCPMTQADITIGVIVNVNRQSRSFTTISNNNPSSAIVFNLADDAMIFDRSGKQTNFNCLTPGMRVMVRHASRMTFSIPPQTTAYEIWVK